MFSDTSTSITRAGVRPAPHTSFAYNSNLCVSKREGIVVKTGAGENFECSVYVYCHQTREVLKCNASVATTASKGGVGTFEPFYPGDRVLIDYMYGDTNKPCITARLYKAQGLSEVLLSGDGESNDIPLPQPGDFSPSGDELCPSPITSINTPALYGGFVSIRTRGMII
jgi:hypothetical protein